MSNGLVPRKIDLDKPRKVAHLKWNAA